MIYNSMLFVCKKPIHWIENGKEKSLSYNEEFKKESLPERIAAIVKCEPKEGEVVSKVMTKPKKKK